MKVFGNAGYMANCDIAKLPHASKLLSKRFNVTLKERLKVQRAED
jgi:hypothetical protein